MADHAGDRETYTAANRAAWDESARHHRDNAEARRLRDGFATPGFSCLDKVETDALNVIGVGGRSVAQICCNNARELLSVKNMGAGRCVGFDQSEPFLEQGRELAAIAGQEIELVAGDIYAIDKSWDRSFDVVIITIGVFGWMPDLAAFFSIVARLLKPDGHLVVHEEHPVMNMFEPETERPFEPANDYFRSEPLLEEGVLVYDGKGDKEGNEHYWFFHTMGDVMTGVLDAGLTIERYSEYANNISIVELDIYQEHTTNMPMSYVLVARR